MLKRRIRTTAPLAARAKTGAIFVKRIYLRRPIWHSTEEPPPSPRDEKFVFVTNCPPPEQTSRIQLLGSEQTAGGELINFRQEHSQRALVFPIRCLSQRASTILDFRTEQIPKGESAPEAAWSSVRKWCGIFVKKLKTPATKYRGLNTVTALLWMKFAPLSIDGSDLSRLCLRCSMDNVCGVCGLAYGSFSLMGIYDLHLQNEENDKNDRHSQTLATQPFRNDNHIRHFEMM